MKRLTTISCCVFMAMSLNAQQLPYQNPELSAAERACGLLTRLTLDDNVILIVDSSPAIARLVIL